MLEVEKWAQGKSFVLQFVATQVVSATQDIHLAFLNIKQRQIMHVQFPLPHLPSWFALYKNHHLQDNFIRDLVGDFGPFSQEALQLGDDLPEITKGINELGAENIKNEISKMSQAEFCELVKSSKEFLDGILKDSFDDLSNEIKGLPPSDVEQDLFEEVLKENELVASFYFLISVPCWILYKQHPVDLYRRARLGKYEALEKLLRLDSLMLHDPYIGKQMQRLRLNGKRNSFQNLLEATLKKPRHKITRQKMKYVFAGFISSISNHINQPLTAAQIKELFDAAAKDFHNQLEDNDIPAFSPSFKKALQRERPYWDRVLKGDKKI
jgi:hypothetical protein